MHTQAQQTTSGQTTLTFEIGLLLLLSLIWGSSFTLIKVAIPTIPPFTMVAARVTIAAILLIAIARAQGTLFPPGDRCGRLSSCRDCYRARCRLP